MKRWIAMLLCAVLIMGAFPLSAMAADWGEGDTLDDALSELKVGFDDTRLNWLVLPSLGVINLRYTYYMYQNERTGTVDQHPVYCIDPTRAGAYEIVRNVGKNDDGSDTATYIRGEKVGDAKYRGIMAAGYPHNRLVGLGLETIEEGYYATKLALWMYIRGNDPAKLTINPAYSADDPVANRVREAAIDIYTRGTNGSYSYTPGLTLTGKPNATAILDSAGQYYVQEVEVCASGWVGTNPDACGDVQLSWDSAPPAGTIVFGSNGEDITNTLNVTIAGVSGKSGLYGKATVKYPVSEVGVGSFSPPTLKASAIVPNDELYIAYAKLGKDYYQRYLVERDPKIELTAAFVSQIQWEPSSGEIPEGTGLRIKKVEAGTNSPLAGAVFEIRDPDGKLIYSLATNDSGIIDIPLAVAGNYTVTETTPPEHHLLPENRTQSVSVTYNSLAEVTFTNAPYGALRVVKRDASDGSPLGGAAVRIRNIETNTTQESYTDSSGSAYFDRLPVGGYEIIELTAPDGYVLDSTIHTVNVVPLSEGETSYTLTNAAKPGLRIIKFDRQTMTAIEGVTFEVYHDGELRGSYVTDAWGEIELRDLPAGTYTVKEVSAPEPYVVDPTVQWVELTAGQEYISELVFFNLEKPGIHILKVDSETLAPLPNARFEVELVGGGFEDEYVTDENGEIDLAHLEPGAYTVTELAAPNGYLMDGASRVIQINAGENAQFVFTNTKKPTIEIVKCDAENNRYLPGATIRIAKIEDGSHYLDRVTDVNGKILIDDLNPGVYSVREVAAPSGYVLSDTEYHVELFPSRTSSLVINNAKKPDLQIIKRDADTGALLAGASFKVRAADSATYATITTDEVGEAWLYGLDPGVYEITETLAPEGYLLNTEKQLITLFPNRVGVAQFTDHKKPGLTINKIDSITKDPLAKVRFKVEFAPSAGFSGGVTSLGDFTTNDAGQIILNDNLKVGWYRVTELAAPSGYIIADPATQIIHLSGGENKTLTFENIPKSAIIIRKTDSDTRLPIAGATFEVRYLGGTAGSGGTLIKTVVTSTNGTATITGLEPGTYVVEETVPAKGYELSNPAVQTAIITNDEQCVVELVFSNAHKGALIIQKLDSVTKQPLKGATFKVTDSSGAVIGATNGLYTTDAEGLIHVNEDLDVGTTVIVQEITAPEGYILDTAEQSVKIKENTTHTLTFYNRKQSGILLHKTDSVSGKGIYGVKFLIMDGYGNPLHVETTDQDGYIYTTGLSDGKYQIREIEAAEGYYLDKQTKTFYIRYGSTATIKWTNTPQLGQIQITKLSGDDNEVNGLPAGSPLSGAVFEVYNYKSGNLVDRFVSGTDGRAVSKPLPLGRYTVKEVQAPKWYTASTQVLDIEIEFPTQIIKREFLNYSANTGVTIRKTGNYEAMPGNTIRYDIRELRNTSTVPLTDFYWRDIIPTDALRLTRIVTGTYNQSLKYKVMITTNKGDTRVIADNLSTTQNNVIDCNNVNLGLYSDEYVTSFTLVFGTVKAGFSSVVAPQIYTTVLQSLPNGYQFANKADVGGKYGGEWVIGNTTWRTTIFNPNTKLPRTGY